jgi:hypothetical protein
VYDNLLGIRFSPESNLTAGGMPYGTDPQVLTIPFEIWHMRKEPINGHKT